MKSTTIQKSHFKKNSELQSIESSCHIGTLPIAHPHSWREAAWKSLGPVADANGVGFVLSTRSNCGSLQSPSKAYSY